MSRSRRKPYFILSKAWDKFKEHSFRRRIKKACRDVEINFDPDGDFLELTIDNKKLGSCGTRLGWNVPPCEADSTWMHESYKCGQRK